MGRGINQPNPNSADGRRAERRFFERIAEDLVWVDRRRQEATYLKALHSGGRFDCSDCHRILEVGEVGFDEVTGRIFHFDSRTGQKHEKLYAHTGEFDDLADEFGSDAYLEG